MELLVGIVALAALAIGSVLVVASFPLGKKVANWLAAGVLAWSLIVVGSIGLSELHAIGLAGFTIWQLVVLFFATIVWNRRGRPHPVPVFFPEPRRAVSFIKRNAVLGSFLAALSGIHLFLVLPTSFVDSDAAHYHIPRAHYWIHNQTARHFYTDDIRQVERPPNSSFLYMWQVLTTDSYRALNLPQWLAAVGTALAIGALSRSSGHGRAASVLAGAVYLSLPAVVLQMTAPWNDLLTAFGVAVFVYFVVEGIKPFDANAHVGSTRYLAYAGLAFGLMVGTKFTSFLPLPTLAVMLSILLVVRLRQRLRPVLFLAASCLSGFVLLGAYNYVLNVADFGRPIQSYDVLASSRYELIARPSLHEPILASVHTQARIYTASAGSAGPETGVQAIAVGRLSSHSEDKQFPETALGQARTALIRLRADIANLVRHVYQVMDWIIVKPLPGADTLYAINNHLYRALDARLGLALEHQSEFNLTDFGMRSIRSGEIGFGPLGYAVLLSAPVAIVAMTLPVFSGRVKPVPLGLLVLGLATFVTHPFVGSWTSTLTRYHSGAFALLIAALIPFTYSRNRLAILWLFPIGFLALWSTFQTAARVQELDRGGRNLMQWQANILANNLPEDAHVGTARRVEYVHILEQFPDYRFEPIPESDLVAALVENRLDGALVLDTDDAFQRFRVPLEHDQSLLMGNAREAVGASLDEYGVTMESGTGPALLEFTGGRLLRRLGPDVVQIFLPTTGPLELGVALVLELTFPVEAPESDRLALVCEGSTLETTVDGRRLVALIPSEAIERSHATQLCRLRIRDLHFGERIPSPTIDLALYPASR